MRPSSSLLLKGLTSILATAFSIASASAAGTHFSVTQLTTADGYPSHVNTICVEERGYTWLGSIDGLYLMTNRNVSKFTTETGINGTGVTLPDNYVNKVVCDRRDNLWILTDKGMAGISRDSGQGHSGAVEGIPQGTVFHSVLPDDKGVYFGSRDTVWFYGYDTGAFESIATMETGEPYSIDEMYFGFGDNIILFNKHGQPLYFLNSVTHETALPVNATGDDFCSAFVDSRQRLWVCKFNEGLTVYDHNGVITSYNTGNSKLSNDIALCYAEHEGKVWVGTDGGGIDIIDPQSGEITVLKHNSANPESIPANVITTLFCDHNGHIWAGRQGGGAFVLSKPYIRTFHTSDMVPGVSPEGISFIYQDGDTDTIWLGTYGNGLISYNPDTDSFKSYPSTNGMHIYTIANLNRNTLCLSCPSKGIYEFDKHSGAVWPSAHVKDIDNYFSYGGEGASLCNDDAGRLVCFGYNLSRYDQKTGSTTVYELEDNSKARVHAVFGSNGLYAVDDSHLYIRDNGSPTGLREILTLESQPLIRTATMGYKNDIWFACGDRVYRYKLDDRTLEDIDLYLETMPMSLMCDTKGRLWIGTRNSLCIYFISSGNFIRLSSVDGAPDNEYTPHAKLISRNGDIYFGGIRGFVKIDPEIHFPSAQEPEFAVSQILLNGAPVGDFDKLRIPSRHKSIDVILFAKSDDILRRMMYNKRVTGPHGNYTSLSNSPELHFSQLEPGSYGIYVSSTTFDGRWTPEQEVLSFRVKQPWFSSWWFMSILFFALIGGAIAGIYFIQKSHELQHTKSADEERLNFLVNVNHELRTPVTLIQGRLTRMLKGRTPDDPDIGNINSLMHQVDRINYLMNTILTVDKISRKPDELVMSLTEVNEQVANAVADFGTELQHNGISVRTDFDINTRLVKCDTDKCRIVFDNIMMNAISHSPANGTITVATEDCAGIDRIRVSISDEGPGIGITNENELFTKYYSSTEDHVGFGIGLSYCKTIIDLHHGSIGAYNNPSSHGATFWFELPYSD